MSKGQMAIGFVWLALCAVWAVLTVFRIFAGDEYHHQLVLCLVCSGLSTQAFNHAVVLARLEGLR